MMLVRVILPVLTFNESCELSSLLAKLEHVRETRLHEVDMNGEVLIAELTIDAERLKILSEEITSTYSSLVGMCVAKVSPVTAEAMLNLATRRYEQG